jgi:hypothetical protein
VERTAERPHAAVQPGGVHRPVVEPQLGGVGADEDAEHRRGAVDAAADAPCLERLVHAGAQDVALAVELALDLARLEDLELGDGGGGDQRGAAVGALIGDTLGPVALGVPAEGDPVHEVGATDERGTGRPPATALARQVRSAVTPKYSWRRRPPGGSR